MNIHSNKTLNNNWYEDRLLPEQMYRAKPELRTVCNILFLKFIFRKEKKSQI